MNFQNNMNTNAGGKKRKKVDKMYNYSKKQSMFKTPDTRGGKVGVIGSGSGMTSFVERKKHEYEYDNEKGK